jgi:hypothetical protein
LVRFVEKIALLVALIAIVLIASAHSARKKGLAMADDNPSIWTELDLACLREGFRDDLSIADIAGQLLRTKAEVVKKSLELGITLRAA